MFLIWVEWVGEWREGDGGEVGVKTGWLGGGGKRRKNYSLILVDTCDLFLALIVDAITSDPMWFKCVAACLVVT